MFFLFHNRYSHKMSTSPYKGFPNNLPIQLFVILCKPVFKDAISPENTQRNTYKKTKWFLFKTTYTNKSPFIKFKT